MSDAYMTEFWAKAPPPWNTLGPEIAAGMARTSFWSQTNRQDRWARAVKDARISTGLTQFAVAKSVGIAVDAVVKAERALLSPAATTWAKLAAFYGITLE